MRRDPWVPAPGTEDHYLWRLLCHLVEHHRDNWLVRYDPGDFILIREFRRDGTPFAIDYIPAQECITVYAGQQHAANATLVMLVQHERRPGGPYEIHEWPPDSDIVSAISQFVASLMLLDAIAIAADV